MRADKVTIPLGDAWLIARFSRIVATRVIEFSDEPAIRRSLLRMLFGIQRLPMLSPDLILSICAGYQQVVLDPEHLSFVSFTDDWHTVLRFEYFKGSSHCIEVFDFLEGTERREAAVRWLDEFQSSMSEPRGFSIDDLSTAGFVDEPPVLGSLENTRTYSTT